MIDCSLMESPCCSLAGGAGSSGNFVNLAESPDEVAVSVCAIVVIVMQRTTSVIIIFLIMLDF